MNTTLPIYSFRDKIIKSVNANPVVIITADTGSGKSTQVCQYLYEDGYDVIVTQPRRLAAVSLANFVSEEMNDGIGIVAFHTGFENNCTKDTKIKFCTDGLQLVKTLSEENNPNNSKRVLILDEVHEWNINIETLIAWSKKKINEGWNTKVVIMSATLDSNKIGNYFGENTPIIDVPGRLFPVDMFQSSARSFISIIKELSYQGKNILAFVPGKREIESTIDDLQGIDAVILPLHGELSMEEQKLCFKRYGKPKIIISTNVAQTSVTVPDIDAVVDSGLERSIINDNGVEGLFLGDISQADCIQRKGRAGRVKNGIYYLCSDISFENRKEFSTPEIQRLLLDQMCLRLMAIGIDAVDLDFFHQPDKENLKLAKTSLEAIGAIKNNEITEIGKKISHIPISARYARMIIEANELGVVEDVITITAILETGSLLHRKDSSYYIFTQEKYSDLLAELDVWNYIQNNKVDFKKEGIIAKNFFRIKDLREKIINTLQNKEDMIIDSDGNRDNIIKACISGLIDKIFYKQGSAFVNTHLYSYDFQLDEKSCISYPNNEWLIGLPIRIEFKGRWGDNQSIDIIRFATSLSTKWISDNYPDSIREVFDYDNMKYYSWMDACIVSKSIFFNGNEISTSREYIRMGEHPRCEILKKEYIDEHGSHQYISSLQRQREERLENRQKTIEINGYIYELKYFGYYEEPTVYFNSLDELYNLPENINSFQTESKTSIKLAVLGYQQYTSYGTRDLISKIENDIIGRNRIEIKSSLPKIKSMKFNVIIKDLIPKVNTYYLGKDNGKSIFVYSALDIIDKQVGIKTFNNKEEADNSTNEALKFITIKYVGDKYGEKNFQFKIDGKRVLTNKGRTFQKSFLDFVDDCIQEISIDNFEDIIEMIDIIYSEVMEGYVNLDDLESIPTNKDTLVTLSTYLTSAGIFSDILGDTYILPITLE